MKPNEEMTYEAILARQNAIFERYEARQKLAAKPTPSAKAKATERWTPPLEVAAKTAVQSTQRVLERTEAELEEAQRKRNEAEYHRNAEIANFQAIELGYAQRQAEALASRRYDPLGLWGPPNYKLNPDD
jgi:hypothetical protein